MLQNNVWLRQLYCNKTELEKMLILSCLFSVGLTVLRVIYTGEFLFVWLNWNLFLAFVPYAITRFIAGHSEWAANNKKFLIVFISWLLFIPNSFYIITDLFHLSTRMPVPLWFDLALILSFAWNGLLLGILSVRQIYSTIKKATLPISSALQREGGHSPHRPGLPRPLRNR